MNRRNLLKLVTAATFATTARAESDGKKSPKKGWAGGDSVAIKTFGASWYYTWWHGGNNVQEAEFVPMIKRGADIPNIQHVKSLKNIEHILGFNEPERRDQGNTTLDDAIRLWPKLVELAESKNLSLGSPAPSSDKTGMDWLAEFMRRAKREKLRVDFVAIHWYRSRNANEFASWLKELDKTWRLPIWLTEFNGWSGPEREHRDFLRNALRTLERSRQVERYAYFEPGKGKPHSLYLADGKLSKLGELYRDAG